jgi:glucosamine--fructose-6-phosphate aminotransferase (isomerizing)
MTANDATEKDTIINAMEIKSRGGYIVGVSPQKHPCFDFWIQVPDAGNMSPIVNIIPIQLLSYYTALELGHEPDRPRNLAKSVTVK